MRYPLPNDTAQILAVPANRNRQSNLGLVLDRHSPIAEEVSARPWSDAECDSWALTDEAKRRYHRPNQNTQPIRDLWQGLKARRQAMLDDWRTRTHSSYTVPEFELTVDYRLVVGFGAEHVLETSLCLHRIYGFPMIPGSALKGVARAAAFWAMADALQLVAATPAEIARRAALRPPQPTPLQQLDALLSEGETKEQKKIWDKLQQDALCSTTAQALTFNQWQSQANVCAFYRVFGTTSQRGAVAFFDAYPKQLPKLELDVLNPHAGPYYSDKSHRTPPADYHDPKPTFFLTVSGGTQFCFALASQEADLAQRAKDWLYVGLTQLGVGGKTAAGYGFLR